MFVVKNASMKLMIIKVRWIFINLNYAIFRSEPIFTLSDLAQIGSHNKREKKAYNSNPDINKNLSKNNIELVPLTDKYVKGFYNLTKEYKKNMMRE